MQGRSQNVYMFSGAASGRQRAHMVHPVSPSVICFANATSLVRGRLFEGVYEACDDEGRSLPDAPPAGRWGHRPLREHAPPSPVGPPPSAALGLPLKGKVARPKAVTDEVFPITLPVGSLLPPHQSRFARQLPPPGGSLL